ncbi:GlxA family transcriptional regulator [Desulfovibrio gilichinskyi]|uniref:Transcriptional regulator, AraC family with amidase-like domain n=1 Tax=Desulfovibrio gilichinskyi TaxID=1519643 RepID=A0A1X7CWE9_9BACT|nr:helix-turn-helix domain-containing protein [Desulfovibrio gilichinskyi]SMF04414.1 transcriptional regulator, AraC family with amidase-like domain [Desulfovibrio gilichinskyi]
MNSVAIDNIHAKNDSNSMPSITILNLKNSLLSGVLGPLEIFTIANTIAQQENLSTAGNVALLEPLELASIDGNAVSGFTGVSLAVHKSISQVKADIVIIPPIFGELESARENKYLIQQLGRMSSEGTIIATVCAGSFLLAETGFLDGKIATTHWKLTREFENCYPKVDLHSEQMLIDGGNYICAGGAMAWQDLALHIVARFMNKEIASKCAKTLVMDSTRNVQTPYFMFDQHLKSGTGFTDRNIEIVQKWMQQNYYRHVELLELAEIAEIGVRSFLRRFKRTTGHTPVQYLQQLRIESARHLLEVSNMNIEEITERVGYENGSSFRRLFKKKTGLTPLEYRKKFSRIV